MFHFALNDDQHALAETVRRYANEKCSPERVREAFESRLRFSPEIWRELADLGVFGLPVAEAYGGSGLGWFDLTVVYEALARSVAPAPLLESAVVAHLIGAFGTEKHKANYLPRIASGELIATYAIDEPDGAVSATARRVSGNFELSGSKLWSPYAKSAGLIVCAVRGEGGVSLMAVEPERTGLEPIIIDAFDDTYQICEIKLDGVSVSETAIIGAAGQGLNAWTQASCVGALLSSAELLGCVDKSLELVVAYSKDRVQFGKPIGSFQAVKHRCADILTDLEAMRGSVYYAAWALEKNLPDAEFAVSSAKAFASDAAVKAIEQCLQSFGAIGFTWEHDIHLFLKRAKRLQVSFGDARTHRERVAALYLDAMQKE